MRKVGLTILLITYPILATVSQSPEPKENPRGELTVIISGLNNDHGNIKIGLFHTDASWNDREAKLQGAVIPVKNRKAIWVLKNLPYGQYAVKFFHDENNDDKLNTNILGMPKETYGFYQEGTNRYIPPGFDKAKFNFQAVTMQIELKN